MQLKNVLESRLLKDFSSLFFSNIFEKFLGLIRELVIAFFLGSSILYANFLLLRIVADFFSQLTAGNALKANLLPRFTKLYQKHESLSLKQTFLFSQKTSVYLFIITQLLQTVVIFCFNLEYDIRFFAVSIILSLSISFNFINTLFLTVIQAKGQFQRFSLASIVNSSVFTSLAYPFIAFSSIVGLALSRFFGALVVTVAFVSPLKKESKGEDLVVGRSDFHFPTLILGNFVNIILISSRFIAGSDGTNSITYFMYAVVVLNTLLTSVVGNISTLTLRSFSIRRNTRMMIASLAISIFLGVLMILSFNFFGRQIIDIIYVRGEFNAVDAINTSQYLYRLSYSFLLLFIATALFQPFLSLSVNKVKKERFYLATILMITILVSSLFVLSKSSSPIYDTVIVMTLSSAVSVLLAIYSYYKYLMYEN
mgnify:CR=1 FL=1|tara:strand:+ start:11063 stop:12334 length:1272 start_codon:yes stop_codon:yes gene_type:complete